MKSENNEATILGIDIGGTGIKAAIVAADEGKLLDKPLKMMTPQPATFGSMFEIIRELVQRLNWRGSIGCGYPGVVKSGRVYTAANLDPSWIGVDLASSLRQLTSGTVRVINDADAAGIAEMMFGAGKPRNKKNGGVVLLFTLGTGIGSALFVDGHLVPNTEFGHIVMDGTDAEKLAATVVRERENLSWEVWAKRVNRYLQYMEMLFSPDCIIIGGGVSENPELFFPYLDLKTEVLPAKMANDAGIIGAALSILI
ncbi:MAG: ROK family protein [candidate division KSB1 bacterium]|nr:ROK family protein [candidate division KSB1 bacterium]MDZ7357897.1 ROK family protein [candidate division KSB1 bacterium]MDZ7375670.1 ROK family protein [candidate division KSB1 bacterium]MDZ7401635.1 ROK family protein [candidate division KSB1 bacterium]